MESFLQEIRRRGTLLFPLQHYEMYNETGHLFVSAHWHREIELICQIRGTAVLTVEGTVYDMNPGDIYFINSGFIHQFQSHDPESFYYAYVFPLDSLAFIQEDYSQKFYLSPLTGGTISSSLNIMNTNRQVLTEKTARISFLRSPNRYITVGTISKSPM